MWNCPRAANGKLPVGAAVGKDGRLTVVKDLGLREPYVGMVNLVSGEIAEDFAMYFTASEQVPSLVSLGVLVGERVEAAGGLIIQMLPGASEAAIQSVEQSAGMFMDISGTMREYTRSRVQLLFFCIWSRRCFPTACPPTAAIVRASAWSGR